MGFMNKLGEFCLHEPLVKNKMNGKVRYLRNLINNYWTLSCDISDYDTLCVKLSKTPNFLLQFDIGGRESENFAWNVSVTSYE